MNDRRPDHRFRPQAQISLPPKYQAIFEKYKEYTMIAADQRVFYENLTIIEHFATHVEGALVECGTWKGGMACSMMAIGGAERNYYFYDSFDGLPDANELDGTLATEYQKDTQSPVYHDNCKADYEDFLRLVYAQNIPQENISVNKGWFEDTVPDYPEQPISVLRLDGDWYDSTMTCLRALYPYVAFGGVIIIDDYEAWEGCARAVHDYLSETGSRSRIDRTPLSHVTFIQKLD